MSKIENVFPCSKIEIEAVNIELGDECKVCDV